MRREQAAAIAIALSLVAGLSSLVLLRSTGLGNRARLDVLGRTAIARAEVPGLRLLHESRRQANWPEEEARIATASPASTASRPTYLDPSRHSINLSIAVAAPSVRGPQDIARYDPASIDRACLDRPSPVTGLAPPVSIGCSPVDALLSAPEPPVAALPLSGTPRPPGAALTSPSGRPTTPTTTDGQGWDPQGRRPAEPPELLSRHRSELALESDLREAEVHAYRFSSHDQARAFQTDAVRRVCGRAIELFNVPGVPGAIAFRQFVAALGARCDDEPHLIYDHSTRGTRCWTTDYVFDYISFVRGQFAFDVVAGTADTGEWGQGNEFVDVDLGARRANVIEAAKNVADRASAMA